MVELSTILEFVNNSWFIQAIGYIALSCTIYSMLCREMLPILRIKSAAGFMFAAQMFMLGGFAAAIICIGSALRSLMLSYSLTYKQKILLTIALYIPIWGGAFVVEGLTWHLIVLLFPLPVIVGEIIARPQFYRAMYLISAPMWMAYSALIGSQGMFLNASLMLCTCIFAMLKERRRAQIEDDQIQSMPDGLKPAE